MAHLEFEIERAAANGDVIATEIGSFSGAQRSLENLGLEVGDTWTFPKDGYKVCLTKVGNTENIEYIWINLENGSAKKFFPSTFTKSRGLFEEDEKGRPAPLLGKDGMQVRMKTEGSAAELFRTEATVDEGMNKLRGKKVTVTKVTNGKILNFNDPNRTQNTQFYTIELVEK